MRKRIMIVILCASSAVAVAEDASRLQIAKDGSTIIDVRARLVWSRCAEGMIWRAGECAGEPKSSSYHEAAALAKARSHEDGLPWRLPTAAELKALAERLRAIETGTEAFFPQAPRGWYWTSSVRVETARVNQYDYANVQRGLTEKNVNRIAYLHAWVVDVDNARARSDMSRRNKLPVRLVRRMAQ